MRKPAEQKLFERTVKSLPYLNDESLEVLSRLVRQLQTARRVGRSNLLNSTVGAAQTRPSSQVPQRIEEETP